MHEINSLSLMVGTSYCNANCRHCAAIPLRNHAPKKDGIIDSILIHETIKSCHAKGARYLTISSTGEPTLSPLSVTKALSIVNNCSSEDIFFNPINLYSNGIRIAEDENFSNKYLPLWKKLGLTTIYLTVHSIDEEKNARIYNVKNYPSLKKIVSRIKKEGLLTRANIVLSKSTAKDFNEFYHSVNSLRKIGFDSVSAWPIRDLNDEFDLEFSPLEKELIKMHEWAKEISKEYPVRVLLQASKSSYSLGQKLTLFQNGILSNKWCN